MLLLRLSICYTLLSSYFVIIQKLPSFTIGICFETAPFQDALSPECSRGVILVRVAYVTLGAELSR